MIITQDILPNTWSKEKSELLEFTLRIKFLLTGGKILVYKKRHMEF